MLLGRSSDANIPIGTDRSIRLMDNRYSGRQSGSLGADLVYSVTRLSTKHLDNVLIVRVNNRVRGLEAGESFR